MDQHTIHGLISEANRLSSDLDANVATKLLCCVLEIAKMQNHPNDYSFVNSGYFWEKMDKALNYMGYRRSLNV
jgi:hypothetical protein